MTAIVAGQGLGLFNTSLGLLGAGGQLGQAPGGRSGERVYVNAGSGNLIVLQQDEWLVGVGPDVALLRSYNSQATTDHDNGDNWRLGLSRRISGYNATDNTVRRIGEDGSETVYHWDATRNSYVSRDGGGAYDTLAWNGSAWTWTDGDSQLKELYEVTDAASRAARLKSVTDLDGKSLTVGYNGSGLVSQVKTASGETVYIDYDGTAGKTSNITQIRTVSSAGTQTRVRYGYDTANRLSSVTVDLSPQDNAVSDADTYVTTYTYVDATSRRLDTLKQSDGSLLDFDYDANGRIKTVKERVGGQVLSTSFDYSVANTTRITDALGQRTTLVYESGTGRLLSITGPAVGTTTASPGYSYDGGGNVLTTSDGQGQVTHYKYDNNGNRIYERDAAGQVVERLYGSRNELLKETRYRRVDPDGDGAELPAEPMISRYVYDSKLHLRFVVNADGRVTEHQYNSIGQRVTTLQHGGGLYSGSANDLATLQSWASGQNKALGQRTDYAYDVRGQLSRMTQYSQLDVAGAGLLNGEESVTQYVYDPAGNLLQNIEARGDELANRDTDWALARRRELGYVDGNGEALRATGSDATRLLSAAQKTELQQRHVTSYQYDGLNRLVRQTNPLGQNTLTVYNDALRQTSVTLANGLVQVSAFDEAGRLLKTEQRDPSLATPLLGATTYQYDKLGRLVKVSDATGATRYTLYDAASRKIGEVDGEGALTEYFYDRNNRLTGTRRYANPLSPAVLKALAADPSGAALPANQIDAPLSGWNPDSDGSATGFSFGENDPAWTLEGENTLWLRQNGTAAVSAYLRSSSLLVSAGKRYEVSAYTGAQRAAVSLEVVFYDVQGQPIGSAVVPSGGSTINNAEKAGGQQFSSYKRLWGFVTAPANATSARVVVRKAPTLAGQTDSLLVLAKPHVSEVAAATTTATGLNIRPPATLQDILHFQIYDQAGRLARTLQSSGNSAAVVDHVYDGAQRLVETTRWATRLRSEVFSSFSAKARGGVLDLQLEELGSTVVEDHPDDRRTRQLYSDAGLLLGTLDGDGYLTEHSYDAAGRLVLTRRWAQPSPSEYRTSGSLAQLRPSADPANDTLSAYFYNARGQLTTRFDAESHDPAQGAHLGVLTTYRYDGAGNKTGEIRHARRVSYKETAPSAVPAAPAEDPSDQLTAFNYDEQQRLVREATRDRGQPQALVTELQYDIMGQVVQTTRGVGLTIARTRQSRYDKQGRLVAELSGEGHKALAALPAGATEAQIEAIWQKWGTRHSYDAAGRRIATVTPNAGGSGDKTVFYYDAESRLTHSINALGEVTQYSYDSFGQQVRETRYGARLATTAIGAGGLRSAVQSAVAALQGAHDTERRVYDRQGLLTAWYDAQNRLLGSQSYNAFGELTFRLDYLRDGEQSVQQSTLYRYNRRGLLERRIEGEFGGDQDRSTQTLYDAFGRVWQHTDARGGVTTTRYDRLGRQISVTGALGATRSTSYDAFSRVVSSTDGLQRSATTSYDPATRKMTLLTLEGIRQVTERNAFGEVVSISDGRTRTEYDYDRDGRLTATRVEVEATGALATRTITSYDLAGRVFETQDGRGTITRTSYDAAGRVLTRVVDPNTLKLTTTYRYDAKGQAVWMKDASGVWTQTEYDLNGHVTAITVDPKQGPDWKTGNPPDNPQGLALRTEYSVDLGGRVQRVTEGAGSAQPRVTEYVYDSFGRRVEEIAAPDSLALRTTYTYDANDNVSARTDARGQVTRYVHDAENRLQWTVDATGAVRRHEYDAEGRLSRSTAYADRIPAASLTGLGLATTRDDLTAALAAANANYASHSGNQVEIRIYDRDGRLTHSIDPLGYLTRREYDTSNNLTKQTRYKKALQGGLAPVANPAGVSAELVSFAAPAVIASGAPVPVGPYIVQDADDQTEQTFYDAANRAIFSVDALNGVTQRRYDGNGNVTETRRYAQAMTGTKVVNGLLTVTVAADNARDQVRRSVYDRGNREIFTIDPENGVIQREYDALGRVKTTTRYARRLEGAFAAEQAPEVLDPGATPSATSKSWVFRAAAADVERDARSVNVYDRAGRLTEVHDAEEGITLRKYDETGRLKELKEGLGTSAERSTGYGYDAAGRLESETRGGDGAAAVVTRYVLDRMGNRERIISPLGVELAETDSAWAKSVRAGLAGYGARRAAELSADEKAALHQLYSTTQEFDAAGRVTRVIDAQGGATRTEYDAFGNAVKITDPNGNVGYFYFDRRNQGILHVNPDGAVVETTYTAFGTVDTITRYFNRVDVAGDKSVHVLSETRPPAIVSAPPTEGVYVLRRPQLDQTTRIGHDKLNRQTTITDAAGYVEKTEYDTLGNKWRYTNKVGGVFTYTHDRNGRVKTETAPEQAVRLDAAGNPVLGGDGKPQMADVVTTHEYDARGNLRRKIEATGLYEQRITEFEYDRLDRQVKQIGQETPVYDGASRQEARVRPTIATRYDVHGNIVETVDARGGRTLYYHDTLGRQTARVDAAGVLTTFSYDKAGNKIAQKTHAKAVQLSGGATLSPAAQPQILTTAPAAGAAVVYVLADAANDREVFYSYDKVGRPTGSRIPNMSYGQYEPPVEAQRKEGKYRSYIGELLTQTVYDTAGNAVKQIDGNGNVTRLYYDRAGRKVAQLDAALYLVKWDYDGQGNVSKETRYANALQGLTVGDQTALQELTRAAYLKPSAEDRITVYAYDKLNRVRSETRKGVETATFDGAGKPVPAKADAVTSYEYDGLNNITRKTDATRAVTDWKFDKLGRQVKEEKPQFTDFEGALVRPTTEREYDALGNVRREIRRGKDGNTEADDRITRYSYDRNGWMISQTDAANAVTEYRHDAAGNVARKILKDRINADGVKVNDTTYYVYDALNREIKNTDEATGTYRETRYNSFGELTGRRTNGGGANGRWHEFAEFDRAGRAWKTSASDGIVKLHGHDRAGNAVLTLSGHSDLSNTSLKDATARTDTDQTYYIYDARNQVSSTYQVAMGGKRQTVRIDANTVGQSVFVGGQGSLQVGPKGTPDIATPVVGSDVKISRGDLIHVDQWTNFKSFDRPNPPPIYIFNAKGTISIPDTQYLGPGDVTIEVVGWVVDSRGKWREVNPIPVKNTSWGAVNRGPVGPQNVPASGGTRVFEMLLGRDEAAIDYVSYRVNKNLDTGRKPLAEVRVPTDSWRHIEYFENESVTTYNWQKTGGWVLPKVMRFTGQPSEADKLLIFTRPNATLPWSGPRTVWKDADGSYTIDWPSVGGNNFEFLYLAMTPDNKVVNRQTWQATHLTDGIGPFVDRLSTGVEGRGGPGIAFATSDKLMHVVGQDERARNLVVRYRVKGSNDAWVQLTADKVQQPLGAGTPGWFAFPWDVMAAGQKYEFDLRAVDANGTVLKRSRLFGGLDGAGTPWVTPALTAYEDLRDMVRFTPSAQTRLVRVRYRAAGSAAYSDWQEIREPDHLGRWAWDAGFLAPYSGQTYSYDLIVEAYSDEAGTLLNNRTAATVSLGADQRVTAAQEEELRALLRISLPSDQKSAVRLVMGYREQIADSPYQELPAQAVAGEFRVSLASIPRPTSGKKAYECYYDAFDANNNNLGRTFGTFTLEPANQSAERLDWIIEGPDEPSTDQIQRHYGYNAFGEASREQDGRGNVTDFAYNTAGRLTVQLAPLTTVVHANGFRERMRPTTRNHYDLAGRLIGVADANQNTQSQTWLAGGEGQQLTAERHAYGSKRYGYDVFGERRYSLNELAIDANDYTGRTDYLYDRMGRLIEMRSPERKAGSYGNAGGTAVRAIEAYSYDAAGQRITHTNALGKTEKTYYDSLGRVTKAASFAGALTRYDYRYLSNIVGNAGAQVGGWEKTTTNAVNRKIIERSDLFGRLAWKQDFGNHSFTYRYNGLGSVTSQTGSTGQNIAFSYYANGYIESIWDKATGAYTRYEYDKAGNRTLERYFYLRDPADPTGPVLENYQGARIEYDELNRVVKITDPQATITYDYDAAGNRRHVNSYYHDGHHGDRRVQDFWYTYDALNRFNVTMGTLVGPAATSKTDTAARIELGREGVGITYNGASQRTSARNAVNGSLEEYFYTADGYLADTHVTESGKPRRLGASRAVDLAGRVTGYKEWGPDNKEYSRITEFTDDHRVKYQSDTQGTTRYFYYGDNTDTTDSTSNIDNAGAVSRASADGAGELARTEHVGSGDKPTTVNTYYAYEYWDEAKQFAITNQAYNPTLKGRNSAWGKGYASIEYDVNGHVKAAIDVQQDRRFKHVTDAQGLILRRDEVVQGGFNNRRHRYYYVNGVRVGDVGNDGPSWTNYVQALADRGKAKPDYKRWRPILSADFDQNYQPIGADYPKNVPISYTVKTGDTLQTIAAAVWGDRAMWYLIADANGLTGTETLVEGQRLTIPPKVANIHNNSGTFRVYDPNEAMGDMHPTLPAAPKPPGGGCGALGIIVMIVVAVVATVLTAGALTPGVTTGLQALWTAGTTTLGAGLSATAVAAGAVGSAASQLAGMAMGNVESFSWSGVAMGAIGAGVGAAMGPSTMLGSVGGWQGAALRSAAGNAMTQGIAVATDLQKKFDWKGVAAAAVGGAVSYGVNKFIGGEQVAAAQSRGLSPEAAQAWVANDTVGGIVRSSISGTIGGGVRGLLQGQRANWAAVAVESFGQALGDGLVAELVSGESVSTLYADRDIARSELRVGAPYQMDLPVFAGFVGAFGDGVTLPVDRSNDMQVARYLGEHEKAAILESYEKFLASRPRSTGFNPEGKTMSEIIRSNLALDRQEVDDDLVVGRALTMLSQAAQANVSKTFQDALSLSGAISQTGNFGSYQEYMGAKDFLNGLAKDLGGTFEEGGRTYNYFGNRNGDWADESLLSGNLKNPTFKAFYDTFIFPPSTLAGRLGDSAIGLTTTALTLGLGMRGAAATPRINARTIRSMQLERPDAMLAESELHTNRPSGFNELVRMGANDGPPVPAAGGTTPTARVDVSDRFVKVPLKDGEFRFEYGDPTTHGLHARISKNGTLSFDIRAKRDLGATHGSGTDMAASLMKRLNDEGLEVKQFDALWMKGSKEVSTNYWYYERMRYKIGELPAARGTWTGRFLANYGFDIVTPPTVVNAPIKTYLPRFVKVTP
ncbi:LysM peptidoglycan-binding domain-containing protein [Aquabacterium sp. A7-Y]|uniref:LysM peptidoglycan-binding domain-containing protein n=1 Tax=Aquabacterium sp. A7-Y TaxID=1349605 RepID=UPI00223D3116|nr:LysM peptidoglycan-binding domain-containing protein [Aquabacterium sp. A7-Y]MCW7537965.1 LysM peptidoglycan-binding domain-containing protein [Aquabacterium sp. A7-Y]